MNCTSRSSRLIRLTGLAVACAFALGGSAAYAASQTWDGGAGTNILNTPANWTNDSLPTTANDTATFGNLASGTLQWNAAFGPGSGNTGGVNISYTGVNALTLDAANSTSFGLGDITLSGGAGIFTLGDGTGTSTMTIRDPTMTFTNDSSNTAVAKSDVVFGNGGGSPRTLTVTGSGGWRFETPLFSAVFGGLSSSALVKSGNGTLTLGTQNFHQGNTTLSAGILAATASSAFGTGTVVMGNPSGRVQVSGGITLPNAFNIPGQNQGDVGKIENVSGNNTLSGTFTWNQTGGLFTNFTTTSGTLNLTGALTTAGGVTGSRTFQFGGNGDTVISGSISDGAATVNLLKSGNGVLTLSGNNTYSGTTSLAGGRLALGSANAIGSTGTITFSGGSLQYSANNTTDYSARFSNAASQQYSIDTNGQTVSLSADLTSSGGSFTKLGSGSLTLSGNNTYSGGTVVSAGQLIGTTASLQGAITNNAAVEFAQATTGTYSGAMGGSGSLTKSNSGTVTLSGSNSYGGGTTISGGRLVGTTTSLQGAITNNAEAEFAQATSGTYAGNMTGSGSFTKSGAGSLTLTGSNGLAGGVSINAGTLAVGSANALGSSGTVSFGGGTLQYSASNTTDYSPRFANAAGQQYSIDTNGQSVTLAGNLASSGGALTKLGSGVLTLSGNNTYDGATSLAAGVLSLGSANALAGSGPIVFTGGTLQFSASNSGDYSSRIAAGTSTGSIAVDTNNQTVTFATGLTSSQSGGLTKTGSGTLVLTASSAFGGNISAVGGLLDVRHGNALSSGTVSFSAGRVQLSNGITLANAFSLNGATNGPTDSISFSRIENLSGNNTISGNITWNSTGGLFTNISSTAGTLTLSGNVTTAVIVGSRTFNFTGSGDTIISGSISNGSATVGLTKNGSGTLTISGFGNTYSGSTTVSVGRLVVNGNLGTGTTTVASGATLGGNGSLGGLLAVNSGAFVAPGNSPGNLTLQAGLSLAGTYSWELGALSTANPGIDFDTITVTAGNVDLTGASLALNLGAFAPSADVFWTSSQTWSGIILNAGAGSLSGSFAAIDNSSWSSLGSFSTVIDGNDVNLVWTAVPEPGAAVLAVLGVLGMGIALRRKRR